MDLVGPQNACIGLGQELLKRGHKVYFLANEKFGDKFSKYGFVQFSLKVSQDENKTDLMKGEDPIKAFTDELIKSGFFSDIEPIEKVKLFKSFKHLQNIFQLSLQFEPQIKKLIEQERPDVIIIDSEIMSPCLINSGIPWIYLFCSNPIGFFDSEHLPPFMSDFPTQGNPLQWKEFRQAVKENYFDEVVRLQRELSSILNYPEIEGQYFIPHSSQLNIYQFPEELDYHDVIQIPSNCFRVDACCREEEGSFELPESFLNRIKPGDKLIYVTLGSMGSCDVQLMKKIITILGKTPHWYIVSKGMKHTEFDLADNMWGAQYVPQTHILPMVDLVIHHGGNNTLTESIVFGKPMIVMPIFYDQLNNAQRVEEKGFGLKLNTYGFSENDLLQAIELVLNDQKLQQKLKSVSVRIRQSKSKELACVQIEKLAQKQ